ncbi:sulfite oxidase [Bacillus shivajii]|uniref:sulfite oxidase n=1 Tax=Bacillus shivajii TaxID=1983719 RepID=UPI001CFAD6E5|nr:sulfite oxidase [Bacillus shivajii]UCZ52827.1 sulfite oxidase [Bacillus shivajii]
MNHSNRPQGRPYLTTKKLMPENQETPIQFLKGNVIHKSLFFRRNHFAYPSFTSSFYWLPISGSVQTPKVFSIQEMMSLPAKTIKTVSECSGNKREFFEPKVFGEQWGKGAISQGVWRGVPLRTLLQHTGIADEAKEVVFEGYDFGKREDSNELHYFARSLPLQKALHPDTIVAYEYNNEAITFKHGYPLRLIVPDWYAMASVKWIKQITVVDRPFKGPYQTVDYVYYPDKDSDRGKMPVTTMNVNSTIQQPLDMQLLDEGTHRVHGIAWTGKGHITNVDVSFDDGKTWNPCELTPSPEKYSWIRWHYDWDVHEEGEYNILSRATDSTGRVQPKEAMWNRKGFGYNAQDEVKVKVE